MKAWAFSFKAKEPGLAKDFQVGRGGEAIAHLQFANDAIPFSSTWDEFQCLKEF